MLLHHKNHLFREEDLPTISWNGSLGSHFNYYLLPISIKGNVWYTTAVISRQACDGGGKGVGWNYILPQQIHFQTPLCQGKKNVGTEGHLKAVRGRKCLILPTSTNCSFHTLLTVSPSSGFTSGLVKNWLRGLRGASVMNKSMAGGMFKHLSPADFLCQFPLH